MDTIVLDPFFTVVPDFFGVDLQSLYAQQHPTAWVEFEKGLIDESTYIKKAFKDGRDYDHAGLKALCTQTYAFLPGMEALLQELKALGHPLYALSNYPIWYQLIEEKLKLSRFLQWDFVSCKTGHRKPDPRSYLGPAEILKVEPSHCLFIDDRQGNCDAARAAGLDSIKFESADALRRELIARHLLPEWS